MRWQSERASVAHDAAAQRLKLVQADDGRPSLITSIGREPTGNVQEALHFQSKAESQPTRVEGITVGQNSISEAGHPNLHKTPPPNQHHDVVDNDHDDDDNVIVEPPRASKSPAATIKTEKTWRSIQRGQDSKEHSGMPAINHTNNKTNTTHMKSKFESRRSSNLQSKGQSNGSSPPREKLGRLDITKVLHELQE